MIKTDIKSIKKPENKKMQYRDQNENVFSNKLNSKIRK